MLERYRIVSLDPGTNCTGISVIEVDVVSGKRSVLFVETIDLPNSVKRLQYIVEMHGERYAKILASAKQLKHIIELYRVDAVVSESPYLGRFAASFAALTEILFAFRSAVFIHNPGMPFYTVEPSVAKKHMGVKGTSKDKNQMTEALKCYDKYELYIPSDYSLDSLDEHSIDSICVGLTHLDGAV